MRASAEVADQSKCVKVVPDFRGRAQLLWEVDRWCGWRGFEGLETGNQARGVHWSRFCWFRGEGLIEVVRWPGGTQDLWGGCAWWQRINGPVNSPGFRKENTDSRKSDTSSFCIFGS